MDAILQVSDILTKEKEKKLQLLKELKEQYKEVAEVPKGSIAKKKNVSGEYFYLNYYSEKTKKGVLKYLGKDNAAISVMQEQIEKRKNLEKSLNNLGKDLEAIEKMLKIANKRTLQYRNSVRGKMKDASAQKQRTTEQPHITNELKK